MVTLGKIKKIAAAIVIIVLTIICFFFYYKNSQSYDLVQVGNPPKNCYELENGFGCASADQEWCKKQKGDFVSCGSACIGEKPKIGEDYVVCIQVCSPNCFIRYNK